MSKGYNIPKFKKNQSLIFCKYLNRTDKIEGYKEHIMPIIQLTENIYNYQDSITGLQDDTLGITGTGILCL